MITFSKIDDYSSLIKLKKFEKNKGPMWAHIEITSDCNLRCSWCYGKYGTKKEYMDVNDYKILLQKLKEIGIVQVTITGGEPTIHPFFNEFISLASSHGFIIHLNTNGTILNEGDIIYLKDKVKQINFNLFAISNNLSDAEWKEKFNICNKNGIETVACVVIGDDNIHNVESLMNKASIADRIRIWDVVSKVKQNNTVDNIFDKCYATASKMGYNNIISYEPLIKEGIHIPCIAAEGLILFITSNCKNVFCHAYDNKRYISDLIVDSVEDILGNLKRERKFIYDLYGKSCPAREDVKN